MSTLSPRTGRPYPVGLPVYSKSLYDALHGMLWKLRHTGGDTKETAKPVPLTSDDVTVKAAQQLVDQLDGLQHVDQLHEPHGLYATPASMADLTSWIERHDAATAARLYILQGMYYNLIVSNFDLTPKEK